MAASRSAARLCCACLALALLVGCGLPAVPDTSSGSRPAAGPVPVTYAAPPAASDTLSTPLPPVAPSPLAETGWQELRPGVQFRRASVTVDDWVDWLTLLRVDPARVDFQARYDPDNPQPVRDWQMLTGALAVVNAGFFNQDNRITGLLISDGQIHGQTYRGFGGMFFVRDGRPALHWLAEHPYRPDPRITQAVQSFPMLARNGQVIDGIPASGRPSRRSFVGIDRDGWVVFGVTTMPVWSLTALAEYLVHRSGLALDSALNLDGGASSGMWVSGVPDALLVNSIDPVPAVIVILPRR